MFPNTVFVVIGTQDEFKLNSALEHLIFNTGLANKNVDRERHQSSVLNDSLEILL